MRYNLDLSGSWEFALDPEGKGVAEGWYDQRFNQSAKLPGSVVENGYGDPITVDTQFTGHVFHEWYDSPKYAPYRTPDNIKIPSFLTPPLHYVGSAWFIREIEIPPEWRDHQVSLFLERCNFKSAVWVDGQYFGQCNSLSTPHIYLLGRLSAGRHLWALCIDNRLEIDPGVPHAINDWIQTRWCGVVGRLELQATPLVHIGEVQVYPELSQHQVRLKMSFMNHLNHDCQVEVSLQAEWINSPASPPAPPMTFDYLIHSGTDCHETAYPMEQCKLWDEFEPNLYRMTIHIRGEGVEDTQQVVFGMREYGIKGKRFTINDRPVMLRGTHEAGLFPLTGYASMSVDDWRRIFNRCREYGLNHMRFHSWCPPEATFQAADELGFYLQVEGPFNGSIGDGKPVDEYLKSEMTRILDTYGNHPSFVMMAHGNEPGGEGKDVLLASEVQRWREHDTRHLYTAGSGWPLLPENDYHCNHNPRLQLWGEGLMSRINSIPPNTNGDYRALYQTYDRPLVIHEAGQWCVYPDFNEIKKYTGLLKPKNFEIFRDFLNANHMGDKAEDFFMASGSLQALCYKAEIEYALRTPECAGFQLLDLHDYSGQGSALVGVLDPFWDPKPYISAASFRRFCNSTVPLVRMEKVAWTTDEIFRGKVEVSHFGPSALKNRTVQWSLADPKGKVVAEGIWNDRNIDIGECQEIGEIVQPLKNFMAPQRYQLTVAIQGTDFINDWSIWVYPSEVDSGSPENVLISEQLDESTLATLLNGGRVLLLPDVRRIQTPCKIGFSSMFWNVSFTNYQAPHTLGILCDPHHPVFQSFPTEEHSNWQWWDLIHNSAAIVIDDLPAELQPLIQPIDNWFDARRLSLLFEAKVGAGSLVVCTMDLTNNLSERPVARQMRHSLLQYMAGDKFAPTVAVTPEKVQQVLSISDRRSQLAEIGATILKVSSEIPEAPAKNLINGSPATLWLSNRPAEGPLPPHHVVIDMGKVVNVAGLIYFPRKDVNGGRVGDYRVHISDQPDDWGEPVKEGRLEDTPQEQTILFSEPRKGRYLVLVAENEVHGWSYIAIGELDIIVDWRQ